VGVSDGGRVDVSACSLDISAQEPGSPQSISIVIDLQSESGSLPNCLMEFLEMAIELI